jgi:hypothetical protein
MAHYGDTVSVQDTLRTVNLTAWVGVSRETIMAGDSRKVVIASPLVKSGTIFLF